MSSRKHGLRTRRVAFWNVLQRQVRKLGGSVPREPKPRWTGKHWHLDFGGPTWVNCPVCKQAIRLDTQEWDTDHIISRFEDGPNAWWNLQITHRVCNRERTRTFNRFVSFLDDFPTPQFVDVFASSPDPFSLGLLLT